MEGCVCVGGAGVGVGEWLDVWVDVGVVEVGWGLGVEVWDRDRGGGVERGLKGQFENGGPETSSHFGLEWWEKWEVGRVSVQAHGCGCL